MKLLLSFFCQLAVLSSGFAALSVRDTWIDGNRNTPAPPIFSENGLDADLDGNIESAWFRGGAGSLNVVNSNPGVTPGVLQGLTGSAASSSWTTYLTPDATPLTLVNPGDQLRVSWTFTLSGVNAADTSQSFRLAIVDTPDANRVVSDASPGNSTYSGYGMFMNMASTLGNANPFQLRERADPSTASALLSAAASWTSLDNEESSGTTGYVNGTPYTFLFTATRTIAGALDLAVSMTGGSIGGDGALNVSFTDATPNSFSFDTFSLRPSTLESTAAQFDTSVFEVEVVPEPSTLGLFALALGALGIRRLRSK